MTHTARLRSPADIGLALQQARVARGLSQAALAAALDLPQSTISEMETGSSTIFIRRLLAMTAQLGIELTASWEPSDAPDR